MRPFELYALDSELTPLQDSLTAETAADRAAALIELAWHLRQRDGDRSLALVEEAESWQPVLAQAEPLHSTIVTRAALIRAEIAALFLDTERARQLLATAESSCAAREDAIGLGDAKLVAAAIAHAEGDMIRTESLYGEAEQWFRRGADPLRCEIAAAWGRFFRAIRDPSTEAPWLDAQAGDDAALHPALGALGAATQGVMWSARGELGRGALCHARASDLALEAGLIRLSIVAAINVGGWLQTLGDYDGALNWIERALERAKRTGWPSVMALSLLRLGELQHRLGNLEPSRTALTEALDLFRGAPRNSNRAACLASLGSTQLTMGENAAALESYREASGIFAATTHAEGYVSAAIGEARALSGAGRPDEAFAKIERARLFALERGLESLNVELAEAMAEIHRQHELPAPHGMTAPNAVLHYLEQAYATGKSIAGWDAPVTLLTRISAAWERAGEIGAALRYARLAFASLERETLQRAKDRTAGILLRQQIERAQWEAQHHADLAAAESRRAEELGGFNQTLETRIQERTAELERRTLELSAEIAERERAEAASRHHVNHFRHLFHSNPLPMWVYDRSTLCFLEVNDAAVETYGYARDEFLAMRLTDIRPPEDVERLLGALAQPVPPLEKTRGWRHRRKDGAIIDVDIVTHAIELEGRPARLTVAMDVTRQKAAEARLQHAQKMEAIGQLTGGMAHDFNNLLGVILGNLDFLEEKLAPDSDEAELAQAAIKAAAHGAELTRRLLAFARRQPLAPKLTDLAAILRGAGQLFSRTLGENIRLTVKLEDALWPVMIDVAQLESAVLNLAVNARDAMPRGGALVIEAENVTLDENAIEFNPEALAGRYVVIAVSDTGTGMPPEVLAKVFDPFFTTKGAAGTGLGLSMVHGFVKQSGGHTRIYSEPGHGTTVRLFLPSAAIAEIDEPDIEAAPAPTCGGELILVVEDNEDLRNVAVRRLQRFGYRTIQAGDGVEALAIIRGGAPFDLLFTDVVMPGGVDGRAVAEEARRMTPRQRVLFTSGFTEAAVSAAIVEEFGASLLVKPYRQDALARYVRAALDG